MARSLYLPIISKLALATIMAIAVLAISTEAHAICGHRSCVVPDDWEPPTYSPPTYRPPPVYRPSPQEIERQRRAAEQAARERKATELNNKALSLPNLADRLKLLEEAARLSPGSKTILANVAHERSQLALGKGELEQAIRHIKEALGYVSTPVRKGMLADMEAILAYRAGNLSLAIEKEREAIKYDPNDDYLNTLREWQQKADNAERDRQEEQANRANVQGQVSNLIENLQRPQANSGTGQNSSTESKPLDFLQITPRGGAQNCPFNRGCDPGNPNSTSPNSAAPVDNPNTAAQAGSNSQTGKIAASTPNSQTASSLSQEGFDKNPTIRGEPPPVIIPEGRPRGSAGLSDQQIKRLVSDKEGSRLFNEEQQLKQQLSDKLVEVKKFEDKLKAASPTDRAKIEIDVVKARTERDQINNQLIDTQRKIEETIYVLDPPDKKSSENTKEQQPTQPQPK